MDHSPPPDGTVSFFIVGSARSGTTLVQRLACEIAGVGMPPETHFFPAFASGLIDRRTFPLVGEDLLSEVRNFVDLDSSKGLVLDPMSVVDDLGGTCRSPYGMFEAIVRALVGPSEVYGEKTPGHILWWPPILKAAPWTRFVAVVRDPRAVVASGLSMPWTDQEDLNSIGGQIHLGLAARWKVDQQALSQLVQVVGSRGCLVLRYEDVVVDPDAARRRIAEMIGRDPTEKRLTPHGDFVLPWEHWKTEALGDVTTDRTEGSWERSLSPEQARQIEAICWAGMRRYGYSKGTSGLLEAVAGRSRLNRKVSRELDRFFEKYGAYRQYIATLEL
ncbi:MAG: sulfotransferase [Acidimicrobiales bacterium]